MLLKRRPTIVQKTNPVEVVQKENPETQSSKVFDEEQSANESIHQENQEAAKVQSLNQSERESPAATMLSKEADKEAVKYKQELSTIQEPVSSSV